jgi:hypothetical protein
MASLGMLLLGASSVQLHLLGWVLGAWVPMLCLVFHGLLVRRLSRRGDFFTTRTANLLPALAVAAGLVIGARHGYDLALWWVSR